MVNEQKSLYSLFSKNSSFIVYILAILLLFLGLNYKILYILSIVLFAGAFIYDTLMFLKESHGKYWEKFIYILLSIFAYFSYIQAEAMAKFSIYEITSMKPEYFDTTLSYLKGIYFIPASMLTISFLLAVITFIFLAFSFIPMFAEIVQLDKNLTKSIQKKYLHSFLYLFSAVTLVFAFFTDNTKLYESFFGKNYVQSALIKYSFVSNNSCKNLPQGTLIKLLDSDKVLITNIKNFPLWSIPDDKNATFRIIHCKH